jgi:hypothetical protein
MWAKFVAPQPVRFTTNFNPALCQQSFYISVTEIEPEVEPHRILDDVRREPMAFICVGASIHSRILTQRQLSWQYRCQYPFETSCVANVGKPPSPDESAERHAMTVISGIDIPSGASHDSATFADAGVPTAMLFIRNANGSHNPDEAMEIANFIDVTKLLSAALSV